MSRLPGHVSGQQIRILNGAAPDGDEGDHVRRPHPGVVAHMVGHVNEGHRPADGIHHGRLQWLRLPHHRDHTAVEFLVRGIIQQLHTGDRPKCVHDLLQLFKVTSLTEIGDRLDQHILEHRVPPYE